MVTAESRCYGHASSSFVLLSSAPIAGQYCGGDADGRLDSHVYMLKVLTGSYVIVSTVRVLSGPRH
jgi:hypothetical protein